MAGDITRDRIAVEPDVDPDTTSVRLQQGRVQLDADANEQADLVVRARRRLTTSVVGRTGVPREGGGFAVTPTPTGDDLAISAGRMYVDGLACTATTDRTYTAQPDLPDPPAPTTMDAGRHLAWLDVHELDVTALQDPDLLEPALGGPDTTTRRRTVAQVRLRPVPAATTCADVADLAPPGVTSGTLRVADLGGFRRLENQLYRVVVHTGSGGGATPTFTFSRDNASVRLAVESVGGRTVVLRDLGRDQDPAVAPGDWIELLDDHALLRRERRTLFPVDEVRPATREVVLGGTDPVPTVSTGQAAERHAFLQRWDQVERDVPLVDGALPIDPTLDTALEDGLSVRFTGTTWRAGDHWLVPARAATGTALWPTADDGTPRDLGPAGPGGHHAPLALLDFDGTTWTPVSDCRSVFPALTAITADDVAYDPSDCALITATTVQEALDQLCGQIRDGCTLVVTPGADLPAVFTAFAASSMRHGKICFQNGEYRTDEPLVVEGKGDLVVEGFGAGTRLRALQAETFLSFVECESVTVRDVAVEATRASRVDGGLGGALSFTDCGAVTVTDVDVLTAHGTERASAAVAVWATGSDRARVRVEDCRMTVGHQQVGVLVVDGDTVHVRGNTITARALPARRTLRSMLDSRTYRAATRAALLAPPTASAAEGMRAVTVTRGGRTITVRASAHLADLLQPLADARRLRGATERVLHRELAATVDRVLLDEGRVGAAGFERFRDRFLVLAAQNVGMMGQGIVVGGRGARAAWITDNHVVGAGQGIHVGVSHRTGVGVAPDRVDDLEVRGNVIGVQVTPIVLRRPEGIFVGNADGLRILANRVSVSRTTDAASTTLDGITCHGHFGPHLLVRDNHLNGATIGVRVQPMSARGTRRWLVADNVADGARSAVDAPATVDVFGNMPGGIGYRDLEALART